MFIFTHNNNVLTVVQAACTRMFTNKGKPVYNSTHEPGEYSLVCGQGKISLSGAPYIDIFDGAKFLQTALPITTIMDLQQLVNLGTRCMYIRILL